jgi:hypothetical protein
VAEIEAEIARARVELDLTLDELAVELVPKRLVERAANMVAKSWGAHGSGASGLAGAVRGDAAPLALIGLGIAWLAAEKSGFLSDVLPSRRERTTAEKADNGDARRQSNISIHNAEREARDALHPIGQADGDALELAGGYTEKTTHFGGLACRAGKRLTDALERNPLGFGLAGIVCGAVVALLAPSSWRERELVAGAREELWKRAEELGHRAADNVRAKASEWTEATAER